MMVIDSQSRCVLERIDVALQHISEGDDHFLFDDRVSFIKGPLGSLVYRVVYWIRNLLTCHLWARSQLLSIAKKIDTLVSQDVKKLNKQQIKDIGVVLKNLRKRITKTSAREKFYQSVDEIFQKTIEKIHLKPWLERLTMNLKDAAEQQREQEGKGFTLETKPYRIDHESLDLMFNGVNRKVGVAFCQGWRPSMEDTHIATTISCA